MHNQSSHNAHLNTHGKCAFKEVKIKEQEVDGAGIVSNFSFQPSSMFQL